MLSAAALTWFASALAFAMAISATPGPNNAMLTASGATWGFWPSLPHMLGVAIGFPVMVAVVALGAGEVLRSNPWIHEALRWAGAAYMLFLAWQVATAKPASAGASGPKPLTFLQAALFQWVNPKAWVAAIGAVVTYTTQDGLLRQSVVLALIFLAVSLPNTAAWTLAGVGAAKVLRSPRALRLFNLSMAALLVASLVPLFWGE